MAEEKRRSMEPNTPFHANAGSCSRGVTTVDAEEVGSDVSSKSASSVRESGTERMEGMTFRSMRRESAARPPNRWRLRDRRNDGGGGGGERDKCSASMALWLPSASRPSFSSFTMLLREKSLRKSTTRPALGVSPISAETAQQESIQEMKHSGSANSVQYQDDAHSNFLATRSFTVNAATAVTRAVKSAIERSKRGERDSKRSGEKADDKNEGQECNRDLDVGQTCNDGDADGADNVVVCNEACQPPGIDKPQTGEDTKRQNEEQSIKKICRAVSFGRPKLPRRKLYVRRALGLALGRHEQAE